MIRLALKNPHFVIVVALATIVLGITAFRRIPADLLPIFKTPAVQIVTFSWRPRRKSGSTIRTAIM